MKTLLLPNSNLNIVKKRRSIVLMPESQLEKMAKVKRGEIITFGRFKVLSVGSESKNKVRSNNG
ncbi:hypothetical protein [Saccharolobus islandicus]|uniref:hypothetical protein n=1 Tax=Saccharolobus islandicus TaxID=43080 RepID=UPI00036BB853|nr:hypothetical protein [Sulfolobus islandicus]